MRRTSIGGSKPLSQVQIICSLGEALTWFEKELAWGVFPARICVLEDCHIFSPKVCAWVRLILGRGTNRFAEGASGKVPRRLRHKTWIERREA